MTTHRGSVRSLALGVGGLVALALAAPLQAQTPGEVSVVLMPAPAAAQADTLYRAARNAFNRGDHARAIELFQQLRETEPESIHLPEAYFYEARAHLELSREVLGTDGGEERARELLQLALERLAMTERMLEERATAESPAAVRRETERLEFTVREVERQLQTAGARTTPPVAVPLRSVRTTGGPSVASVPSPEARALARRLPALVPSRHDAVPEGCDEATLRDRRSALHGILSRNPALAEDVLEELIGAAGSDPCSAPLREAAVGYVTDADAISEGTLRSLVLTDPSPRVRRAAVWTLASTREARWMDVLEEVVRTDADEDVRTIAGSALLSDVSPERRERAWTLLDEETLAGPRLRPALLEYLITSRTPEESERFRTLFESMEGAQERAMILAHLSTSEREEDRQWVRERVADPRLPVELRSMALNQAGWRGADMEFLHSLYRNSDEDALRRQVIWTAAGSPDPEATELLVRVYRETEDPGLREAAVGALGQRDDERATRALRAILRGEDPE